MEAKEGLRGHASRAHGVDMHGVYYAFTWPLSREGLRPDLETILAARGRSPVRQNETTDAMNTSPAIKLHTATQPKRRWSYTCVIIMSVEYVST